jgi:hypothetical protein
MIFMHVPCDRFCQHRRHLLHAGKRHGGYHDRRDFDVRIEVLKERQQGFDGMLDLMSSVIGDINGFIEAFFEIFAEPGGGDRSIQAGPRGKIIKDQDILEAGDLIPYRSVSDSEDDNLFGSQNLEKRIINSSCVKVIVVRRNGSHKAIGLKTLFFLILEIIHEPLHALRVPAEAHIIPNGPHILSGQGCHTHHGNEYFDNYFHDCPLRQIVN